MTGRRDWVGVAAAALLIAVVTLGLFGIVVAVVTR